jgi:hypothetical protein
MAKSAWEARHARGLRVDSHEVLAAEQIAE